MQNEIFSAALSGLIHDSGKVLQRASTTPTKPHPSMADEKITVHATWTNAFVDEINPKFRKYARPGVYHHQPDNPDVENNATALRVAIADKLSASERYEQDDAKIGEFPQHMVSVFDHVHLERKPKPNKNYHYLPLKPLALDETAIFPKKPGPNPREDYQELAKNLIEAAQAPINEPEIFLENLLAAYQKNTWCIPSAYYYNLPDISLYDHARTTAALAVCLTDFDLPNLQSMHQALKSSFSEKKNDNPLLNQPVALLVGGDLSGIQNFIYTITAKEAARTLRGRSFYIQLLTEALLRRLLRTLNLPYTNVIYSSGGQFFILAPPNQVVDIEYFQKTITKQLHKYHGISLYLALGWVEIPMKGFAADRFPLFWSEMHKKLQRKKLSRYNEWEETALQGIFKPDPHGGNQEQLCSVCAREQPSVTIQKEKEQAGEVIRVCSMCQSFAEQIGHALPNTDKLYLGYSEPEDAQPETALAVLESLGTVISFDHPPAHHQVTWHITDPAKTDLNGEQAANWLRYVVNELPPGKTFDQLQQYSQGINRLGVLRMDLDDLGKIFKEGLRNQKGQIIGSLARMSMLSFQISLFFEGWVKQIVRQNKYKGLIYAVYSGGDDLFLIGPWDMMPQLALDIRLALVNYVGQNPDIHISGGLSFIHGKYPIHEAANDAGEAETDSKTAGKNRITFLNTTRTWEIFIEVHQKMQKLILIIENKGPHNLLQVLQYLGEMERKAQLHAGNKRVWGPWMWQTDYHLSQSIQRAQSRTLKDLLTQLHQEIRQEMYDENRLQDWGTAARWAQLLIRE